MKKVIILSAVIAALLIIGALIGGGGSPSTQPTDAIEETLPEAPTERVPGEPVTADWFSDAVFVGDSVTLKLSYYCDDNPDALSDAQFFCAGSLGYASSLWDIDDPSAVHPFYRGETRLCEDCAEATGAKKVFIMLGMNDIAIYGTEGTIAYADELYNRILEKSPDVTIYAQSVTPILYGHEIGDLNNENIRDFNSALESYCDSHGMKYIDINSVMADETGYLCEEYCGDPDAQGIHFTDVACREWIETLKKSV